MPRLKRSPHNPLAEYQRQQREAAEAERRDRQATDLLRNAMVVPMEIDDPLSEEKIVTLRSIRNDPLAALHSRKQIDEAQYHGGRAYQHDFETAERGPQAIDPSKEYVDGGKPPEPITEAQRKAVLKLNQVQRILGQDGSALVHGVLIQGQTCKQVATARLLKGRRWEEYFGVRLRECLDNLALVYGFGGEGYKPVALAWKPAIFVPGIGLVYLTEDDVRRILEQAAEEKKRGERVADLTPGPKPVHSARSK